MSLTLLPLQSRKERAKKTLALRYKSGSSKSFVETTMKNKKENERMVSEPHIAALTFQGEVDTMKALRHYRKCLDGQLRYMTIPTERYR